MSSALSLLVLLLLPPLPLLVLLLVPLLLLLPLVRRWCPAAPVRLASLTVTLTGRAWVAGSEGLLRCLVVRRSLLLLLLRLRWVVRLLWSCLGALPGLAAPIHTAQKQTDKHIAELSFAFIDLQSRFCQLRWFLGE
jgi:hypothetical protein